MRDMPGQLIAGGHQNSGRVGDVPTTLSSTLPNGEHSRTLTLPTDITRQVIGVVLIDERCQTNFQPCYRLGALLLDSLDITAQDLRRIMCKQIYSLPHTFTILTKQGWPLSRHQECQVLVRTILKDSDTVMIQRNHDRPRIGFVSTTGENIGFIFGEMVWNISRVRENLKEQLTEMKRCEFRFIDNSGWPVTAQQEAILSVLDIIRMGNQIVIQYCDKHYAPVSQNSTNSRKEISAATPNSNPTAKGLRKLTRKFSKNRVSSRIRKEGALVAKPILISYVRAEAAKHALDLKTELERQGHSVYLDVHEIKTGSDWQDALNFAVSNCQVFVPLITPMYGKTQWTNREVKLADVLDKNIIPISFLEQWPPACLAIQFASTQYIYWKPSDHGKTEGELKICDYRVWEPVYIKRVSKELAERCKLMGNKVQDNEDICCRTAITESFKLPNKKHIQHKFVVISAHPKQNVLVHELKITLEGEGYEVYCSTDIQEYQEIPASEEIIYSSNANTPRDLTSIPERYSVFGQTYNEIANIIADSKRGSAQKNDVENQIERRQLTRMISQVSDISQVSSLTPDKVERLRMFQQKVDLAGVVVIIASEAYTKSKTSQQQVFYCEHRKHVVLIKFDQHALPSWFSMLMGNDMITNVNSPQFILTLKTKVKRALNPLSSETPKDAASEAKIQCLVTHIEKNIPQPETCVYIAGSSKLQSKRSEEIARAIGMELAKVKNITVCTGGFFGAPEIVAHTFYEHIQNNWDTFHISPTEPVIHILPSKDPLDFTSKAHQTPDRSFEAVSFGKTYFAGDSVKERETAVARFFDTCIVIEGGPGAAHEVEEFIWNDHFVIPIISTGGAAGGQYGVPLKILETPPSVSEYDWQVLSDKEAIPEEVAQAVVNIVITLKNSILTHIISQGDENKAKNKTKMRSKKYKVAIEQEFSKARQILTKDEMVQTYSDMNANGHKLLKRQVASQSISTTYKYGSRWQKFLHKFSSVNKNSHIMQN